MAEIPHRNPRMESLLVNEDQWRDAYDYLRDRGYLLRERYKPDWVPSWRGQKGENWNSWRTAPDGQPILELRIGDAIRIRDGTVVPIKISRPSDNSTEREVVTLFNSAPLADDPRNHYLLVYEILPAPGDMGDIFLVTPLLRKYDDPPFDTIGEVVAFWEQMFEDPHFMHLNHTVHRDCTVNNMMLDPSSMYPDSFHPAKPAMRRDYKGRATYFTRTQRPPRYYLIDYGLAIAYRPEDGPPRAIPTEGGDKTAPEFEDYDNYHDPFPTDVYYMGNWVRTYFMKEYHGFDFMRALVDDMTHREPAKRLTMEQAVARFAEIVQTLSPWTLRMRPARRRENVVARALRDARHLRYRVRAARDSAPLIPRPPPGRPPGPAILPEQLRPVLPQASA